MGTEFLRLTDSDKVKEIISNIPFKKEIEELSLKDVHRRVLAEDVHAQIDLPPFNRVSMDGYAVKAEDTFHASEDDPVILDLIDTVRAGDISSKTVQNGNCMEVSTGAPMPEGADAVVMIEYSDKKEDKIHIYRSEAPGQNIAPKGSDIKEGTVLLNEGTLLTHDKVGVLAAVGMKNVSVYKKPLIAVISTGNEIVQYNETLKPGKIFDINSQSISNAVKSCGCAPIYAGVAEDNYESLKNSIMQHMDADVIITSGGTSAGAGDVLRAVLDDIGDVFIHGIAVKPGKPTLIGLVDDKPLFGLPGYPAAALIVFHVFVAPYLRKIASRSSLRNSDILKLKISRRYHSSRGRHQYVLVKIKDDKAYPIMKDSGAITAIAEADGYFEIPKNVEIIMEGDEIEVTLLESS